MIIEFTKEGNATQDIDMSYPDQFLKESQKLENENWVKNTADYFTNLAYIQYNHNKIRIEGNYNLVKGILTSKDFYETESNEVKSFIDVLSDNVKLPEYVQHYSIMGSPLNDLLGELVKRPDGHRFKAFDEDSKSEALTFKTQLLQQYINQKLAEQSRSLVEMNGVSQPTSEDEQQLSPQQQEEREIEQMTMEQMKEYLIDYTSIAEKWANKTLESCKVEFNMKEKAEEIFRDQLLVAKEYMHVYEDNSKTGFNVDACNPKNIWKLTTPDKKYTKDAYAAGLVEVMEISEIIEKVTDLTKEEIDHLRKKAKSISTLIGRSNYGSQAAGINTIKYDTYNRAILQERILAESEMTLDNNDLMTELFGRNVSLSQYGEKFVVVRGYFKSKKLIKKVSFIDEDNTEQTLLTDENYVDGSIPTELSIEEGWTNQWYQFTKIGSDVYIMKPFKLLDYCPIIGVDVEIKNTQARSIVDMMKPFQTLFNICMNQLFQILQKEIGVVYNIVIRKIPVPKDGDAQDALEIWEQDAREKGIVFEDDSPENMKVPGSGNTNNSRPIDLSRSAEIQSRYQLAAQLKIECWDLIGMSRQRLGNVQATETATATNTAITQSYAQTEPLYAQHEYLMDQVYQAVVDAAQYIETNKPVSTLSYINNIGESVFLEVNGQDLKNRDLKIFSTARPQDQQIYNELRQLAQPMLQNGASVYDIVTLYTTNSIRQMKQVFKTLKEQQDEFRNNEQQLKQQELQQQQSEHEAIVEQEERFHKDDMAIKKYTVDVKANTDLAKAEISTYFQAPSTDTDGDGTPDIMEIASHTLKTQEVYKKIDLENKKLSLELQKQTDEQYNKKQEIKHQKEKLKMEDKKIKSSEKIARMRPKPTKSK